MNPWSAGRAAGRFSGHVLTSMTLKKLADKENHSLSNYIFTILLKNLQEQGSD